MTADSLPPQIAAALEVEHSPAADAQLSSDLLAEAHAHAPSKSWAPAFDLESVYRAFGRRVLDERARSGVEAARARAARLTADAGAESEPIALTLAADLVVALAVERVWRPRDANQLVPALARLLGSAEAPIRVHLLTNAIHAPQLTELPPLVALEVQLSILISFSSVLEASVWAKDAEGRIECLLAQGETAMTRRFRTAARDCIEAYDSTTATGTIVAKPIRRWQASWGALAVRTPAGNGPGAALEDVAEAIRAIAERDFLLQRSAARERSLVSASERRLSRLGFDLHDGALQQVAVLASDLRRLRGGLNGHGSDLDRIQADVAELDRVLRELAHSLEPASLLRRPLERVIKAEVEGLRDRTGIDADVSFTGDFGAMTQSQKIAVIRVTQEALTNIREHSNATRVTISLVGGRSCVDLRIEDDGDGFEVTRTLQDAAQRGRLGLVGSNERVRLLGGTFDIRSRIGGPTIVSLSLPRWQPLQAEKDESQQLAF